MAAGARSPVGALHWKREDIMATDQFIDPGTVAPDRIDTRMTDEEYVDFIAEQSFPCSDPPPYYGGYRKAENDMTS